jgi:hypothetical protein
MNPKPPDADISPVCPERESIQAELLRAVDDYVRITSEQVELLKAGDHAGALQLANDLERKNGEQEQAFRALLQHVSVHDCWGVR